jgi:hypothetical protein
MSDNQSKEQPIKGKEALMRQYLQMNEILTKMMSELNLTNLKCFGVYKGKWVIKWYKGKQNKFDNFSDMYDFLLTEGK